MWERVVEEWHARIASSILKHWKFPTAIVAAVADQNLGPGAGGADDGLTDVLIAAKALESCVFHRELLDDTVTAGAPFSASGWARRMARICSRRRRTRSKHSARPSRLASRGGGGGGGGATKNLPCFLPVCGRLSAAAQDRDAAQRRRRDRSPPTRGRFQVRQRRSALPQPRPP